MKNPHYSFSMTTIEGDDCYALIMKALESGAPSLGYTVKDLSLLLGVDRRRIYDMFGVLCGIGLAVRDPEKRVTWVGRERMTKRIIAQLKNLEIRSYKEPLSTLFLVNDPPPLSDMGLVMVVMACFFGRQEMYIDEIYTRLSSSRGKFYSIKRRLYLASTILQSVGVVERKKNSEILKFHIDNTMIYIQLLNTMQEQSLLPSYSIFALLNTIDKSKVEKLFEQRQKISFDNERY